MAQKNAITVNKQYLVNNSKGGSKSKETLTAKNAYEDAFLRMEHMN